MLAQHKFSLANLRARLTNSLFFESGGKVSARTQSGAREPRASRGRLRHCNGLQAPNATSVAGKAGVRFEARSQDTGLVVLVRPRTFRGHFSVKEKDEARPSRSCGRIVECLHSRFAGVKVFCLTTDEHRRARIPGIRFRLVRVFRGSTAPPSALVLAIENNPPLRRNCRKTSADEIRNP